MAKKTGPKLVIVESPAKARTINKYLGPGYVVKASMGHVRDLPSKGMGVDLKTFEPQYEILESRNKVVAELRKLARQSEEVFLATDLDREGEAIAWHLQHALDIPDGKARRVIFNAITRSEIQKAFARPQLIDQDRVNAQQARRILDRIVGYEISPLLWRKVARGLSAGRVQSVAVRLVVERERQIEAFIPEEFWKISAVFCASDGAACAQLARQWRQLLDSEPEPTAAQRGHWLGEHGAFMAELVELAGKKFEATDVASAKQAAQMLGFVLQQEVVTEDPEAKGPAQRLVKLVGHLASPPAFNVRDIERKRTSMRPPAPFITSTLQQAASTRLSLGAQRTMRLAQSLYEAGHITYMRTDSTHLSADAVEMARGFIAQTFGQQYVPQNPNVYASSNKSAQEAHEAIRPTDVRFTPEQARAKLPPDEYKLYQLIWNRFVACQMPPAEFDQTTVNIEARNPQQGPLAVFRASGRKLVFDGFTRLTGLSSEEQLLPELAQRQKVHCIDLDPHQHFTQAPPRFTEASLVKELERLGIGRPSTYASIIQTIQDRKYVEQRQRRFYATMLGTVVTDKLIQAFPDILDVGFTADMELKLDQIEEKHLDWIKLLRDFYGPFHKDVEGALDKLEHAGGAPSPYVCEKCGRPMVYRISKDSFYLACSGYPECQQTRPVDQQGKPKLREVSEHRCPVCGREMIKRRGRFGEFLGCSGYAVKNEKGEPACTTIVNLDKEGKPLPPKPKPVPTALKCEKCGGAMLLRASKRGPFLSCAAFPKCRGTRNLKKLSPEETAQVDALLPALQASAAEAQSLAARITGAPAATGPAAKPAAVPTDIDCDECGKAMVIRQGRRGPFLACTGYPKCKHTADVPAKLLEEMGINGQS
jgi:DNA topoisomerase-1